jgi:DNA-packaging protein gp3
MPATKNNQYWQLRKRHGKPPKYDNAETFWVDACRYFDHITDNPFKKQMIGSCSGKIVRYYLDKQRPFSVTGLCLFLDIPKRSFYNMAEDARLMHIVTRVRDIIWLNQFEGAVAGIFKESIVWRKLSLESKRQIADNVRLGMDAVEEIYI